MNIPPSTPVGIHEASPRKRKGQISFAQSSFSVELASLDDAHNKKMAEDMQMLQAQLQRAKKDKELIQEHCDSLNAQLLNTQKLLKEASTRRNLEEESFRSVLSKAKTEFDRKLVKLSLKARDRDDLLLEWTTTITDLSLHLQHDSLKDLRERTLQQLPPSLRDLVRGEKRTAPAPTLRKKPKKGAKKGQQHTHEKAQGQSSSHSRAGAVPSTTDPEALLAIINENISVLDNFNLKYTSGVGAGDGEEGMGGSEDASDVDVALIRGGYQDYLSSQVDGAGTAGAGRGKSLHYSDLTSAARAPPPTGTAADGSDDSDGQRAVSKARVYSSAQGSRQGTGKGSRGGSRGGSSSRRRGRTPGSPSRKRGSGRHDDDDVSVGSGTVTGSIMDHDEGPSETDNDQDLGPSSWEGSALYEQEARAKLGMAPRSPPPVHASYRSEWDGDVGVRHVGADDAHDPFLALNSRTPRSTEVPGLKLGADESVDGSEGGEEEDQGNAQFAETLRNLQDLAAAVTAPPSSGGAQQAGSGSGSGRGGSAEQRRRMSEMSTNYTDMVKNILDSVSELSRSFIAEEGEGDDEGEGLGGVRQGVARAPTAPSSAKRSTSRGRGGAAQLEAGDSGIEAELAGLMGGLNDGSLELGHAPAALTGPPTSLDALLAQAGVALDALSNLSDDNIAYTPFTQDGAEGGGSLAQGSQQQENRLYSEQEIERLIRTATSAADEQDEGIASDRGGHVQESDTEGDGAQTGEARKSRKKKASAGNGDEQRKAGAGSGAGVGARAGSDEYSMTFESEASRSRHSQLSASRRSAAEDSDPHHLKLGGEWDSQSENTLGNNNNNQPSKRPPQAHRKIK